MIQPNETANVPIPMSEDKSYILKLEHALPPASVNAQRELQVSMNFNYCQAIGELIYAMITCWPDISFPLIKLSQYSSNPEKIHYEAVINTFRYLHTTIDDGLIFWCPAPHPDLPVLDFPTVHKSNYVTSNTTDTDSATNMHSAVDSDWAGDTTHCQSVTGLILRLCGGTILYNTKYQDTIALSTTEAEFTAACDAGKAILYVRSILDEINLPQDEATTLFIDNNGALVMGKNAQQPMRRTRHLELKKFALLDWVQRDLLLMKRISTNDNCADGMTKQTQLFYRHLDYILGKHIPKYVNCIESQQRMPTVTSLQSSHDYNDDNQATIHMAMCDPLYTSIKEDALYCVQWDMDIHVNNSTSKSI